MEMKMNKMVRLEREEKQPGGREVSPLLLKRIEGVKREQKKEGKTTNRSTTCSLLESRLRLVVKH